MLDSIINFFRGGPPTDFATLSRNGAIILDVRSKSEFATGHIKGALNIPVNELAKRLDQLPDKKRPVVTCCASGVRSASAAAILKSSGYVSVFNGGGWRTLKEKL